MPYQGLTATSKITTPSLTRSALPVANRHPGELDAAAYRLEQGGRSV
jgi:hypothetical protein